MRAKFSDYEKGSFRINYNIKSEFMIYRLLVAVTLILYVNTICIGQSLIRTSLSCMGSSQLTGGTVLRQTTGQSSNTSVLKNGEIALRQGFQQPVKFLEYEKDVNQLRFTLWPNPARLSTIVGITGQISKYSISVSNIQGNLMTSLDDLTTNRTKLDLNNYLPGIYIVTISNSSYSSSLKLIIGP